MAYQWLVFINQRYGYKAIYTYYKSDDDFVLRIAPLRDKQDGYKDYFPPPRYGIPPGKQYKNKTSRKIETISSYQKYGLYLWPGKLYRSFFWQTIAVHAFIPTVFVSYWVKEQVICSDLLAIAVYIGVFLLLCAISITLLHALFLRSPPVLSSIWSKWPSSQYEKFLNVPHKTEIHPNDVTSGQSLTSEKHEYWQPDEPVEHYHESAYFAKGARTLQEVILHLAIFDFLFNKPTKRDNKKTLQVERKGYEDESKERIKINFDGSLLDQGETRLIKSNRWLLYLFSPVGINFIMLLIAFFTFSLIATPYELSNSGFWGRILFQFPFSFALPLFIWLFFSMYYIGKIKEYLRKMHREIEEEYYDGHLDLVPQPILNALENMPKAGHIHAGITEMDKIQQVIQAGALIAFLALMEIFSSVVDMPTPSESNSQCCVNQHQPARVNK